MRNAPAVSPSGSNGVGSTAARRGGTTTGGGEASVGGSIGGAPRRANCGPIRWRACPAPLADGGSAATGAGAAPPPAPVAAAATGEGGGRLARALRRVLPVDRNPVAPAPNPGGLP